MRTLFAAASVLALASGCAALRPAAEPAAPVQAQAPFEDPFLWLEEVEGERALAWVRAQNDRTRAVLERDPRYAGFRDDALAIFTAQDRTPLPTFRAGGVDNYWQDKANPRGLWRTTTLESYKSAQPKWEVLLDIDALAKAEGRPWVFRGATCLDPEERLCLVRLSDGGKDAVVVREFDRATRRFVDGGFVLSEGKQYVDWIDRDTLLVGRDWGPGSLTESGYPHVLKIVRRGQSLDQAVEVFRGDPKRVWTFPRVIRDKDGRVQALIADSGVTFFESEKWLLTDAGPVKLPFPARASLQTYVDGQLVFRVEEPFAGFKAGSVLSYDLAALKRDPAAARPVAVLEPRDNQAVEDVTSTRNRVVVNLLEDVKGAADVFAWRGGRWERTRLPLPQNASLTVRSASGSADRLIVEAASFLEPPALWLADTAAARAEPIKTSPARFDASQAVVEQFWATSRDGTRIPYFVVRPKGAKLDGSNPTLLFGYGGFQVSMTPRYRPEMGRLWLERGGIFVNANIRGGGEFGPQWHQSVLRENRQKSFDDFAAVAEDLVARGITTPDRLGIYGRSNGGVLTSVTMTQRPELIDAVVIESPLVDMMRYHKLPAGASWVGEYGDPEVPADAAFIARYSAYQQLRPGVRYPEAYITTNTKDDRVHPGHARKYAAMLEALGAPYLYFEDTDGGHSYDADPVANAERWARHYVYLSRRLMDD